jgi:hypothetical protein
MSLAVQAGEPRKGHEKSEGGCHGTSIDFVGSPSEAAKQAKKEEKLVFVLHVSGNFEDPRFT